MKISPAYWHIAMLVALLAACSSTVSSAQFDAEHAAASPNYGGAADASPVHQPLLQQDPGGWYASPPCDDPDLCGKSFLAGERSRSASSRLGGFYGGIDYLLLRPHFSEAIAFARGVQGPGTMQVVEEPLEFDYQSSLRTTFGYRSASGDTDLRFSYWYIDADTRVNGGNLGPGEFIVDPFGNMVGAAFVLNPGDARFDPTFTTPITMGGDSIATRASVRLNVYDVDLGLNVIPQNPSWNIEVRAGARLADIDQFYDSVIFDNAGAQVARGDFSVDFVGAGPRMGAGISRIFGQQRQFSMFTQGAGALLLGQYDLAFSNAINGAGAGSQLQSMTRLVPVVDMEVGGSWQMTDSLTLTSGYLFQAWFDMGVSGGKFDGFFSGTDDANIMSFDGLFARAEWAF